MSLLLLFGGAGGGGLTFSDPTLFTETWTGTNGAAWDGDWTETYPGGSGAATIQGNAGRCPAPSADLLIMWADTVTLPADYEIRYDVTTSATGSHRAHCYFGAEFMTGGTSGNGHWVATNPGTDTIVIGTTNGYVPSGTFLASSSYTFTNTDTLHVHVKVRGTSCKVRVWKNSEDEPLDWLLTATLTYTFDELHLGSEGVSVTANVDFDNLLVVTGRPLAKGIDTSWAGSGDLIVLEHSHPTWTGDVKAIIWKHGGLGGTAEEVDGTDLWPEVVADGNGRYVLYAADDGFGGDGAFGNDTELASIGAVYTRAQTDQPDFPKIALACHSAGGMGIVNYAYRNLSDVAGMLFVDAIVDADEMITYAAPDFEGYLDAAYGGDWASNAATRDPNVLAADTGLQAIPAILWDATGDAVLNNQQSINFVTTYGANATRVAVASGDHGTVHNFIDPFDALDFLETLDFTAPAGTTVTTTTVTAAFSVAAPTIAISRTATPATVTATFSVGSPAVTVSRTASPTTVTAAFTVGTVTATTTATVATTTATAVFSVATPTVTASPTIATTTVLGVFEVPAPSVATGASATVTTTTVTGVFSVGTPTVTASATVAATTVTAVFNVGAPSVSAGANATVTPTTVTAAFTVGTVTVTLSRTATPATVTGTFTVAAPTVAIAIVVSTTTVTASFTVGTLTVTAAASIATTTVLAAFTVGTVTVQAAGNATVTPTTVLAAFTVAAPAITTTATPAPATVTAPFSVGGPTLAIGAGVAGATVTARFLVGTVGVFTLLAQITGRLLTRRADVARTTRRSDTARTTDRHDTPRTTRRDGH